MNEESYTLPESAAPTNHGSTTADWSLMALAVTGAIVAGVGMVAGRTPVLIAGIVLIALGFLASFSLRALGKGQPLTARTNTDWYSDEPGA